MECPIAKLADEDLAAIFKHLPPFERLIVSEVCIKWCDISGAPWRDVIHLDLSQVPTAQILAVLKKCPNLVSVSALQQNLGDLRSFVSLLSNIASLKCVECTFTINVGITDPALVAASLRSTSWQELIWHNSTTVRTNSFMPSSEYPLPQASPPTLRRLQVSADGVWKEKADSRAVVDALASLPLLESCIVAGVHCTGAWDHFPGLFSRFAVFPGLARAETLSELYLDWPHPHFTVVLSKLRQLKMLYVNDVDFQRTRLTALLTQHASLRVVVLTASRVSDFGGEVVIPARKLFPNGFNAPSVPQLHLFLGKTAVGKLRFHPSPTDALKIYPINAPLPEFLQLEEIKLIFEGSWVASRIMEGVKEGVNLTDYSFEGNAESISYVQV